MKSIGRFKHEDDFVSKKDYLALRPIIPENMDLNKISSWSVSSSKLELKQDFNEFGELESYIYAEPSRFDKPLWPRVNSQVLNQYPVEIGDKFEVSFLAKLTGAKSRNVSLGNLGSTYNVASPVSVSAIDEEWHSYSVTFTILRPFKEDVYLSIYTGATTPKEGDSISLKRFRVRKVN